MAQAEGSMRIVVQDDGVGFNAREISRTAGMKGSYGLFSIEEHMTNLGGSLEIVSEPGKGCKAILRVPMEERER
jgi:NarL family two-component system sensor histidine kinase LiaS